jgi:acylphosphatase
MLSMACKAPLDTEFHHIREVLLYSAVQLDGEPVTTTRMRIIVDGRVQGVFFRDATRHTASALGVAGWVRNLPDGRVEAVFEGDAMAVESAIAWARRGPERALVTSLHIAEETPEGLVGFEVRH